eukprot:COSAG04_NODE_1311_length_7269_cov_4.533333_5_plen_330_part_00
MIAAHGWSTYCAVTADGAAWRSANGPAAAVSNGPAAYTPGDRCWRNHPSNHLASFNGSYTVTDCISRKRVLARCKDCKHGTYDAASSTCACEGNFIGPFCETECPIPDCGARGNFSMGRIEAAREANSCSALPCTCTGDFIGQLCETECGCSGHGDQTAIEAAREAGSCAAGSCACERGYLGELCESYYPPIDLSTVPAQCVAGIGSHGVVYNGTAYRTLDDAPPEGGRTSDPNDGCQRIVGIGGAPNYLPLPPGYALAPPDADAIAVIAAHGWSTYSVVTADGGKWYSANRDGSYGPPGDSAGSDGLASSGGSHTVTGCRRRVLARCP